MALRLASRRSVAPLRWQDELPELRGVQVVLRELVDSDADAILRIARREEVQRFSWPAPAGVTAVVRFIATAREDRRAGRYAGFGVCDAATGAVCGFMELRRLQPDFFRAELGFFLDPAVWGTGVFAEAGRLLLAFAFTSLGAHRVEARVSVDNERCHKALQKLGATYEGRLQQAFVRDGQYVDQHLYALLAPGPVPLAR